MAERALQAIKPTGLTSELSRHELVQVVGAQAEQAFDAFAERCHVFILD